MNPWWEGPIIGFDYETTGPDPLTARPVSVAMVVVEPDGTRSGGFTTLVDPDVPIPAEATAVHGISSEDVRLNGVGASVAIGMVATMLAGNARLDHPLPIAIFNAPFDWPIAILEAERAAIGLPNGQRLVDPLLLDRWIDKYRKGSRKLIDVAHRWGVELDMAHTAGADAIAAAQTARAVARAWGPVPGQAHTAAYRKDDLLFPGARRFQADLYLAWRDDVNAYWARSGAKEADGVTPRRATGTWPCGPLPLVSPPPEPCHA